MNHAPRCDCDECLPGMPAEPTFVMKETEPLWVRALARRRWQAKRREKQAENV